MNKTICFLSGFWGGGPSFYRLELPTKALRLDDWECHYVDDLDVEPDGSLTGKRWIPDTDLEQTISGVEIIVTQRWMNEDADSITRRARETGQKILADLDDQYWEIPIDNPAFIGTNPEYNPLYNRDLYWKQLAACDAVICSTPALQKYLNDRIDVATPLHRNMMDLDLWTYHDTTLSGWYPRVGWSGNTLWRHFDLLHLKGAVGSFVNEHDLEFVHVGYVEEGPQAGELLGINETFFQIEQCGFEAFPIAMKQAAFDIGIVPLQECEFNRAKSCLKGMEYAASGIPFVASPLPEYEWFGVGILAKTPADWRRALESLRDPDFRAFKAAEAYERVQREDFRIRGSEYNDLLLT